jgi:hypothetical protein
VTGLVCLRDRPQLAGPDVRRDPKRDHCKAVSGGTTGTESLLCRLSRQQFHRQCKKFNLHWKPTTGVRAAPGGLRARLLSEGVISTGLSRGPRCYAGLIPSAHPPCRTAPHSIAAR